jgi:hypothetical protein
VRSATACVVRTGSIAVNADTAEVRERGDCIVAVEVDLKSKRAGIYTEGIADDGIPVVWLERTDETLYATRLKRPTCVGFTDFKGWRVYLAEVSRYMLRVVLVKDSDQ